MNRNKVILLLGFFLSSFLFCSGQNNQGLEKVLDFTVLHNGNITSIFSSQFRNKTLGGLYQSYDYKGRLVYDKYYQLLIPDSLLSSERDPYIQEAYALSCNKNHTLFYGNIKARKDLFFYIISDKKGRIKKQFVGQIDFAMIEKTLDKTSFRSTAYFWIMANQNRLRISPYLIPPKKAFIQSYLRTPKDLDSSIDFDSFILKRQEDEVTIVYKDDLVIHWEHKLMAKFPEINKPFKLIETENHFYFILYSQLETSQLPIFYVIDKRTGRTAVQSTPRRNRA